MRKLLLVLTIIIILTNQIFTVSVTASEQEAEAFAVEEKDINEIDSSKENMNEEQQSEEEIKDENTISLSEHTEEVTVEVNDNIYLFETNASEILMIYLVVYNTDGTIHQLSNQSYEESDFTISFDPESEEMPDSYSVKIYLVDESYNPQYIGGFTSQEDDEMYYYEMSRMIFEFINIDRVAYDISPLAWNELAYLLAKIRCVENDEHDSFRGCYAENYYIGYLTATYIHNGYRNSSGHFKNYMNSDYENGAVAVYAFGNAVYGNSYEIFDCIYTDESQITY